MARFYREYKESQRIELAGHSFYGLIMAAMRQADTDNKEILKRGFPQVHQELQDRYNAPGGFLTAREEEVYG